MKSISLIALVCLLLMAVPTFAQLPSWVTQEDATCDAATIGDTYAPLIDEAVTVEDLSSALNGIRAEIAACNGLYFEGDANVVVGPVEVPEGVYIVTATTANYFILKPTVLDGNCSESSIFNLSEGQAIDGAQSVFESGGCRILLEISNSRGEWTFDFSEVD